MRVLGHVSPQRILARADLRAMDDSVNWAAIPTNLPLVAGYVPPSSFAWSAAAWAHFPNSIQVRITPSASVHGLGIQVLDVEPGDATAAQVPGWVTASRAAGQEPTAYTAYGNWAAVINACVAAHVAVPQFWIAEWNNQQNLPSITVGGVTYTAVAHQYADPATSGGDWDSSVVADAWPGVDQGVIMTNPFTAYSANAPILDENGMYTGKDAPNPTDFEDDERFTNASVRWLIEDWVPKVNAALAAIQTGQVPSKLSGTAAVTVNLTPGA